MSSRFEETLQSLEGKPPFELLRDHYEIPSLLAMMAFMVWVRMRSAERFISDSNVWLAGNDAYYHLREVTYIVRNFPATMPYDPWTQYPSGAGPDQFGTLFDQLIATAALIVGLGSPDSHTIAVVLAMAPPVFAALVALPTYLIGRRLGGRFGGLYGVLLLALFPGLFLRRGLVGGADHNVAEPLFQASAVALVMIALAVATRENPVYEQLLDRDVAGLRTVVGWSALAGAATAFYIWMWPPGALLLGILGAYFVLQLLMDVHHGRSPEHVAFVASTSMTVTGLLVLLPLGTFKFAPTSFSLLQPFLAFAIAGGAVFMAWLSREWEARDYERSLYPAVIVGLIGLATVVVMVALPDLWSTISTNFTRFVGFGAGAEQRTISEAQPMLSNRPGGVQPQYGITAFDVIAREYGLFFFTAIGIIGYVLARPLVRSRDATDQYLLLGTVAAIGLWWLTDFVPYEGVVVAAALVLVAARADIDADLLFVLVWAAFITAAAFTQVRFNYYLVVPVAVINAYGMGLIVSVIDLDREIDNPLEDVEVYQVLVLAFAFILVVPVLGMPMTMGMSGDQRIPTSTAMQVGNNSAPPAIVQWDSSLQWMKDNTPAEGTFGGADNRMDLFGTFDRPADGDFDYPEGSYGVVAWWDYGHWITVRGDRIPVANPFQGHATAAANWLLAPSEDEARSAMSSLAEGSEETRYAMIDWKMIDPSAKFSAPPVFYEAGNLSVTDLTDPLYSECRFTGVYRQTQRYYDSMSVRLYKFHGSAVDPQPVVLDWEQGQCQTRDGGVIELKHLPSGENTTAVKSFDSMAEARAFVEQDGSAQIGGFGPFPTERVPALEHWRLVQMSDASALSSGSYVRALQRTGFTLGISPFNLLKHDPAWVKVFERVPGATVEGTAPPNTTVTAQVRMAVPATNNTFTYKQYAETGPDGEFTMVLPYSTTGYENWGPENGYTNVSVRAATNYTFTTPTRPAENNSSFYNYAANAAVTEAHVIGENESTITVDLQKRTYSFNQTPTNGTGTNTTAENTTTDGNTTTEDNTTGTNDSGALAPLDAASADPSREAPPYGRGAVLVGLAGALFALGLGRQ